MSKKRKILLGTLIPTSILLIVVIGGFIFISQSYAPMQEALDALETTPDVIITDNKQWIVFDPINITSTNGFIFYPGGNVEPESYSLVVIVKMPFDLAVFAPKRGLKVIDAFPEIHSWVIGGHSLGGSMASNLIYSEPDRFVGLVLLASYPQGSKPLTSNNLSVLTIYGSLDGIVSKNIPETISLLPPASTTILEIVGGNHANFGSYGDQKGDNPATITRIEQQYVTINAISQFLADIP
jgi:hypothetical protein